ncbi:MAG: depupylase/deamidase Dop [Candidatus Poribacteria bacterium]|nr:depupylase/deamidase Dop [Candidatus Poribacteria bacterium]
MAIPTIMGTETEYGISVKNARDQDPVAASTLVVNIYKDRGLKGITWDYDQENPLMDARGFMSEGETDVPDAENNSLINDILINGGRYYVDHAHPEYCTPECTNARDLVKYEKAGELILDLSRMAAEELLPANQEIIIYKNNSDYKGHSYGAHENYLMSREVPFQDIVDGLTPFLITRQIITGSGKIGAENGMEDTGYQMSQRADFFETEVGLSTMVARPIINTRDEPHADEKLYRRLHVIVGDSNMSEFSIYLKVGITSIVLQLIENGFVGDGFKLSEPVAAIKTVSRDLSCKNPLTLEDGRRRTPVEVQRAYLELAHKHVHSIDSSEVVQDILEKWEFVLDRLEADPMSLDRYLDWVVKKRLIDAYVQRRGLSLTDHQIRMLDLQYHDLRPNRGLYARLLKNGRIERILNQEEIIHAITNPPFDTRAYFRGMCLQKFPNEIHSASWNSMIFCIDGSSLDKILMDRPHFGTQDIVGDLLRDCTAAELVQAVLASNN